MYQPFDYDNDRGRVRKEILWSDIKKWTLRDVGELLDEMQNWELFDKGLEFDPSKDKSIFLEKGVKEKDLWHRKHEPFEEFDISAPYIYDHPEMAEKYDLDKELELKDAINVVN